MLPHGVPPGLGVAVASGVPPDVVATGVPPDAVETGVPPVGGAVGSIVSVGLGEGDVWTTGDSVAVAVGKAGDVGAIVGVGPPDAVNVGGVGVGVPGKPAAAGRACDHDANVASNTSATREFQVRGLSHTVTSWTADGVGWHGLRSRRAHRAST
jgi:hypothetical protein